MKIDSISFRFQPSLSISRCMWRYIWRRHSCICGILYFKFNGIDAST